MAKYSRRPRTIQRIERILPKMERKATVGKTRVYEFNPRYPFLDELLAFLSKSYEFLPADMKAEYYEPSMRKRGKPC